jgi:type IV secretion system protein VirB2
MRYYFTKNRVLQNGWRDALETQQQKEYVMKLIFSVIMVALGALLLPDMAFASGGITDFAGPLEQVSNTITGPVGKAISIIGVAVCGLLFIFGRQEMSEGVKLLVGIVFGISFIAFATNIVNFLFPFSGALVA